MSEKNTICTPGGIVERPYCGISGEDFELGARVTAIRELKEETGVDLNVEVGFDVKASLETLPVGVGAYWGAEFHRNYCVVLQHTPKVTGPEKNSVHEVARGGMNSIGIPAGDGVHAWVDIQELHTNLSLMPACRVPLEHLLSHGCPAPLLPVSKGVATNSVPSTSAAVGFAPGLVAGSLGSFHSFHRGAGEPLAKRPRQAEEDSSRRAAEIAGSLAALLRGV